MSKVKLLIVFMFAFTAILQGQYQKDAAIWSHIRVNMPINNRLALELKLQERIANNVSQFDRLSSNFNLKYKLHKSIQLEFAYAFISSKRIEGTNSLRHRLRTAIVLDKKFGQWNLSYRCLWQWRYKDVLSDEEGAIPRFVLRNRLKIKYQLNRNFTPYIAFETFSPFNGPFQYTFSKYRGQGGLLFHLSARMSIEAYYLFQQQLRSMNRSQQDHVYGIGLNLKL